MTAETKQVIERLRRQIACNDSHTETECAECLEPFAKVLLPHGGENVSFVDKELIISAGRVDLIVIADANGPSNIRCRRVYVWELKAPQLFLCKVETNTRACPTVDILIAENQLLHYCDEVRQNGQLQTKLNFHSNDVQFGGIVIGRHNRLVSADPEAKSEALRRLAHQALTLRDKFFYQPNSIQLLNWNQILTRIERQPTRSHESFIGSQDKQWDTIQMNSTAILASD